MTPELKATKDRIRSYLGAAAIEVKVFRYHRHKLVCVEYEDFLPEAEVEQTIRSICGEDYLVSVKRECSSQMQMAIITQMIRQVNEECRIGVIQKDFPTFCERMENFNYTTWQ